MNNKNWSSSQSFRVLEYNNVGTIGTKRLIIHHNGTKCWSSGALVRLTRTNPFKEKMTVEEKKNTPKILSACTREESNSTQAEDAVRIYANSWIDG